MTPANTLSHTEKSTEAIVVFGLAIAAAVLIKLPALFGIDMDQNEEFYARNMSLFILPLLTIYFIWKRQTNSRTLIRLGLAFILAIIFANVYPFNPEADTGVLVALHLPISLWLVVGIAFTGDRWSQVHERMNFIRFSGELFIYYVLIALGGGVLMGFMAVIFQTIEINIEPVFESWILPCGATGAVIVASWLVEIKQGIAESLAPMLARLFSPLFTIVLITFLVTLLWTGRTIEIERDVLIAFDMLLILALGLLLYSASSRDFKSNPGVFDWLQVVLIVSALIADIIALWAIGGRINEFGFTPNRVVALGMNVILLVNLFGSAILYIRFLRGRGSFSNLEKWQTDYLPVYAIWGALVVILIPPLFGYA